MIKRDEMKYNYSVKCQLSDHVSYTASVTKRMRFYLVALVLTLSLLCQAWGKHLLVETEDEGGYEAFNGDDNLEDDYWGQAASNSHAANNNNIQIG